MVENTQEKQQEAKDPPQDKDVHCDTCGGVCGKASEMKPGEAHICGACAGWGE